MTSSDGSDIELKSALPKKLKKKMPNSPSDDILKKQEKKLSTKIMINQALTELKTRKGVSLYAIKKFLTEKFSFDTEKNNYLIKKSIKSAVEEGTIVQTKGIGATGSFKLVPVKEKKLKPKKPAKEKTDKDKDPEKKAKEKAKKTDMKKMSSKSKETKDKSVKPKKKVVKEKDGGAKGSQKEGGKMKKVKISKVLQTPSKKKAAMMKRKSIGSIIKPPKMKPKAKA